jgi:ATP adenylyltransferase
MIKQLWAPWRMEYILRPGQGGCFFCKNAKEKKDDKNFILFRNSGSFIILNIYPYTYGHLMVAPFRHVRQFSNLKDKELLHFMKAIQVAERVLERALKAQGFNLGLNIGRIAGAGIKNHIHLHVVPRWEGDTNFMPLLSEVRVLPERLEVTYQKLKKYFKAA